MARVTSKLERHRFLCRILPGIKKCIHIFHRNLLVQLGLPLAVEVFQCSPAYKTHFIKYQTRAAVRFHLYAKHGFHCKRKIRNFPTVQKLHFFYLQNSKLAFQTKKRWGSWTRRALWGSKRNPCASQRNNSGENCPAMNTNIPWEQRGAPSKALVLQPRPHCGPGLAALLGSSCSSKASSSSVRSSRDSPLLAVARSSRE